MSEETKKENKDGAKKILDPAEQIRLFGKGKMTLSKPIADGENMITELHWDFMALTGAEYVNAMDGDRNASNTFKMTSTQAMHLFAAAAAKETPGVDAADIRQRMGIMDAQKAVQLATIFFTASNRLGYSRISEE